MKSIDHFKSIIQRIVFNKTQILKNRYPQYDIGRHSYGNPEIRTWKEGSTLKMGAFCSIADGVKIFLGGEHRTDWVTTYPFSVLWDCARDISGHPRTKGDVIIGNDVWIGADTIIMSGVTIGDGAVIGAGSMVTKNIEPYAIWAGNPATFIKNRFDQIITAELLQLKWWDLDDSVIKQILPHMLNNDIGAFISEVKRRKLIG